MLFLRCLSGFCLAVMLSGCAAQLSVTMPPSAPAPAAAQLAAAPVTASADPPHPWPTLIRWQLECDTLWYSWVGDIDARFPWLPTYRTNASLTLGIPPAQQSTPSR